MRRVVPLLLVFLGFPAGAPAQEGRSVVLSAGLFDTAAWFDDRGDFDALEGGVALHGAPRVWGIAPMGGVSANDDGAFWIYIGARRPIRLGKGWSAGPTFAAAYYDQGDSKNLGHELEFRSGLEVSRLGASGRTVGVEFYHLSNASIADVNPGSNSLVATYSIPLRR